MSPMPLWMHVKVRVLRQRGLHRRTCAATIHAFRAALQKPQHGETRSNTALTVNHFRLDTRRDLLTE